MNEHNFSNKRIYTKAYGQCIREDTPVKYTVVTF